jgi:hypothetical protein
MSRQELADEVNTWLAANRKNHRTVIDETYVGRLERGDHRWPGEAYRDPFQAVLGAAGPANLGFYRGRETPGDALAEDQVPQLDTTGGLSDVLPPVTEIVVRGAVTVPLHTRIMKLIPPVSMDVPRRIGAPDVTRIEATTSAFRD